MPEKIAIQAEVAPALKLKATATPEPFDSVPAPESVGSPIVDAQES